MFVYDYTLQSFKDHTLLDCNYPSLLDFHLPWLEVCAPHEISNNSIEYIYMSFFSPSCIQWVKD